MPLVNRRDSTLARGTRSVGQRAAHGGATPGVTGATAVRVEGTMIAFLLFVLLGAEEPGFDGGPRPPEPK